MIQVFLYTIYGNTCQLGVVSELVTTDCERRLTDSGQHVRSRNIFKSVNMKRES